MSMPVIKLLGLHSLTLILNHINLSLWPFENTLVLYKIVFTAGSNKAEVEPWAC